LSLETGRFGNVLQRRAMLEGRNGNGFLKSKPKWIAKQDRELVPVRRRLDSVMAGKLKI
jgi:hypothetical protein